MKSIAAPIAALAGALLLPSCATIFSKSAYPVAVNSQPSGLDFSIKNVDGEVVSSGKTPQVVSLKASAGYYRPATYTFQVKRGKKIVSEQQITATLDGWFFGNILIGGVIGMVIVDPLTGAMFKLPESVDLTTKQTAGNTARSLSIASIDTLTPEQRARLVRI